MTTHEAFIGAVVEIARRRLPATLAEQIRDIKLVYGHGHGMVRGVTMFNAWKTDDEREIPFVEISARGEENYLQVACTTLHELGHVLAGAGAGHSKEWKEACSTLGLRRALAAGQRYLPAALAPDLRHAVMALPRPSDGQLAQRGPDLMAMFGGRLRGCNAGIGTRGGKSRGPGSGSRLLKSSCPTCGYTARITAKWLAIGAPICPVDNVAFVCD